MQKRLIYISDNKFTCETLLSILKTLKSQGILRSNESIIQEDDSVINGIRCSNDPTEVTNEDLMEKLDDLMTMLNAINRKI